MQTSEPLKLKTLVESMSLFFRRIAAWFARLFGVVSFGAHDDQVQEAEAIAKAKPAAVDDARRRVAEAANRLDIEKSYAIKVDQLVTVHRVDDLGGGQLSVWVMAAIGGKLPPLLCPLEMHADAAGRIDRTRILQPVQDLLETFLHHDRAPAWMNLCDDVEDDLASRRIDLDNRIAGERRPAVPRSIVQQCMDQKFVDRLQARPAKSLHRPKNA